MYKLIVAALAVFLLAGIVSSNRRSQLDTSAYNTSFQACADGVRGACDS